MALHGLIFLPVCLFGCSNAGADDCKNRETGQTPEKPGDRAAEQNGWRTARHQHGLAKVIL